MSVKRIRILFNLHTVYSSIQLAYVLNGLLSGRHLSTVFCINGLFEVSQGPHFRSLHVGFCGGSVLGGWVRGGWVRGGWVRGGWVRGGWVRGGWVCGGLFVACGGLLPTK